MKKRISQFLKRRKFVQREGERHNFIDSDSMAETNEIGTHNHFLKQCVVSASRIGSYNYFSQGSMVTSAVVGNYCSIAPYACIGLGEHALESISTSTYFSKDPANELTAKDCIIGNDVWIGTKATVRRGVVVGNGAVIGAHAFVNKDVPPFAIVAGIPARIIGYRFEEEKRKAIESSAWWELDRERAAAKIAEIEKQFL